MPKAKPLPELKELELYLRYDHESGRLYWRDDAPKFHKKVLGKLCDTTITSRGYRMVNFNGRLLLAHRVIYKMCHGFDPNIIDHIDGNQLNNRIDNLRSTTLSGNARNRKTHSTNTSGHRGVFYWKANDNWGANIRIFDKLQYLGTFKTKEAAVEARLKAEKKYGFHENHGR